MVVDVACRAPQITAYFRPPLPYIVPSILAKAIDDGSPGRNQRFVHLLVSRLLHFESLLTMLIAGLLFHQLAKAAQVILQVIDAPRGVHLCVLLLMPIATFVFGAGLRSWSRINSQLHSL